MKVIFLIRSAIRLMNEISLIHVVPVSFIATSIKLIMYVFVDFLFFIFLFFKLLFFLKKRENISYLFPFLCLLIFATFFIAFHQIICRIQQKFT